MYARELSIQLAAVGWRSVLCFLSAPPEQVRAFLAAPNGTLEVARDTFSMSSAATSDVFHILRRHRPRILHLHFTSFLNPYSWMAKMLGVDQVYFTDHSSRPEGFVARRASWIKRMAVRGIHAPLTGVICVSRYGYRNFTAHDLIPPQRFHVVYNATDVDRAAQFSDGTAFRRRFDISPERLLVTQVSWLIQEKGVDDFVAVAREVASAEPRSHFLLAGEGAYRAQLEALRQQWGLTSRLTLTGQIDDPLSEGLFAASDVVCQLSRWEEAFGYVNVEAMASGKPVVGTRVGGIPEIIRDGVTGFLAERGDVPTIAKRVIQLLREPALRLRMGQAGRDVCRENFNLKTNVAKLVQMYGVP